MVNGVEWCISGFHVVRGVNGETLVVDIEKGFYSHGDRDGRRVGLCLLGAVGGVTF